MVIVQKHGSMKPNLWNVKDILNIPLNSMGTKAGKGSAPSDYSSLSDSQFLLGSQTWLENSQSFSQDISGQSRGSQQASQEINEMKVSTSYHSKPILFGVGKVTNVSGCRTMGILDRFEEEKRKAKEIEILISVQQVHESLENIKKTFLNCIDGSCDITRAAVAEGMNNFKKIIQDNFATIKESIASQTELLMKQTHREMNDNEAKTSLVLKDLSSLVLSLQQDLESLKLEQSKEQSLLGEILSLLGTIKASNISGAYSSTVQMIDSTVQTSPGLVAEICSAVSKEKYYYEGTKLCSEAFTYSEETVDQSICPVTKIPPKKLSRGASYQVMGTQPFEQQHHIEMQELRCDPNSRHKSYHLHSVTYSSPNQVATSTLPAFVQNPKKNYMAGVPMHIEPAKSLNNINKSETWIGATKGPKRAQRCPTFRKKKRALILPQRRPNQGMGFNNGFEESQHDEGQENRVPQSAVSAYQKTTKAVSGNRLPLQQPSTTRLINTSECGQRLDPWSCSQSSDSSQVIVEYQQAEWEAVKPRQKANTVQRPRVTWQLFDFISDSD